MVGADINRVFLIVGAPKAGTTWLASSLAEHREVHFSPVKEPHFFAPPVGGRLGPNAVTDADVWPQLAERGWVHSGWIRDEKNYLQLLRPDAGQIVSGEGTVAYLHAPEAAGNIAARFPEARIIVMIREPIARALSHFQMDVGNGRTARRAEDVLRHELSCRTAGKTVGTGYLERSLYSEALQRYLKVFGREQVLVLKFDNIRSAPARVLTEVEHHLGISSVWGGAAQGSTRKNSARFVRWKTLNYLLVRTGIKNTARHFLPAAVIQFGKHLVYADHGKEVISGSLRKELCAFFKPDVEATAMLAGLDLSAWLR